MRTSAEVRKMADSIWEIAAREMLHEFADLLALVESFGDARPPEKPARPADT
jgi:hypothetical protein